MINVFIIGARGYIKKYGGWTALIHGICKNQTSPNIQYYIYEIADSEDDEEILHVDNVIVIKRYIDNSKSSSMIKSDAKNTFHVVKYIQEKGPKNPIILFLGLRIGPLAYLLRPYIKSCGAVIMENAAGVEWKRPKWGKLAQVYMRISAYFMARAVDYLICDAEEIRNIYNKILKFKRPRKFFIPYGSYPAIEVDPILPKKVCTYFKKNGIVADNYYLIINRFMPENSYELILSEYVKSDTKKDLILVTNNDKEHDYYNKLLKKIPFKSDSRIKFVGTMYDPDILNYLRQYAFAYINGHTLGGTNPGLLEAMASTSVVLAHNNVFSREVCGELAIYFDKQYSLCDAIKECEAMSNQERNELIEKSRKRMKEKYDWIDITKRYEDLFKIAIEERK